MPEGEKLSPQETGMCSHGNFPSTCSQCNEAGEKSEKEQLWEHKLQELETTEDGLGMKIDGGVKETVAAFQLNELPTSGSCEGHEERGGRAPWIEVEAPERPDEQFTRQN